MEHLKYLLFADRASFLPSPLVGEGGANERSEFKPDEGLLAGL
jgi:hypothetical protein